MVMLRENTAANVASDTQQNLNRAIDFINDEIKTAVSASTGDSLPSGCGAGNSVLTLTIPFTATTGTSAGTSTTYKVYYSNRQPSSIWLGSNAIFRCGPDLNGDGSIATDITKGTGATGLPSTTLSSDVLVDLIASSRDSNDGGSCSNGGTASPNSTSGFFVCISPNGKIIEIHAAASALNTTSNALQWMNTGSTSRLGDKAMYGIVTQTFMRAPSDVSVSVSPTSISATSANGTALTFTIRRAGDISQSISVTYSLSGTTGSFSAGSPASPLTLSGSTPATVTVTKTGTLASGNNLTLTIGSGSGYAIGSGSATVTVGP